MTKQEQLAATVRVIMDNERTDFNCAQLPAFYEAVSRRVQATGERLGQAAFNHLTEVLPELAEKIRGSSFDPFYSENANTPEFREFAALLVLKFQDQEFKA